MASMIREWKSFDDANITVESVMNAQGVKECWMRGIFIQADKRNLNERVYPLNEITRAVNTMNQRLASGQSIPGEMDHPDTLTINLDRVSHTITEMGMSGTNGMGALRIVPTPSGQIIRSLIESGIKLGVSSRGSGNVDHRGYVSEFEIVTVDIVAQPSAPEAYPTPVFESLYKTGGYKLMEYKAGNALHNVTGAQKDLNEEILAFFKHLRNNS